MAIKNIYLYINGWYKVETKIQNIILKLKIIWNKLFPSNAQSKVNSLILFFIINKLKIIHSTDNWKSILKNKSLTIITVDNDNNYFENKTHFLSFIINIQITSNYKLFLLH